MTKFELSQSAKIKIEQELGNALKEVELLKQSLRQQQQQFQSDREQILLELLEVFDAMESPIAYLQTNTEIAPQFTKRLPKILSNIQQKLSIVLAKRQVTQIEIQGDKPDFTYCQVVDREERDDLEDRTITKVVRQGFRLGDRILRPVEIITARNQSDRSPTSN
jgi:molecular chaperone GrpE